MSVRRKMLFSLLTLILLFLSSEGLLRVYSALFCPPPLSALKTGDPDLSWHLEPGYSDGFVTINELGMRGAPPAVEKDERGRILMLGNSCVFGSFVDDERTLPLLLERELGIETLNGGVPGYTVGQDLTWWERDLRDLEADTVIIYAGWNDWYNRYPGDPGASVPEGSLFNTLLEWSYTLRYSTRLVFLRIRPLLESADGSDLPIYENYPATRFADDLANLLHSIRSSGAEPILLTWPSLMELPGSENYSDRFIYPKYTTHVPYLRALYHAYQRRMRAIAGDEGVRVIDIEEGIRSIPGAERLFHDTNHLNEEGNLAAAELIAAAMSEGGSESGPP